MPLTDTEAQQIRKQLLDQIDNVPKESRDAIEKQIKEMTNEQLEDFLRKNQQLDELEAGECIFCAIVNGKSKLMKIDENDEAIAVLDINPISKGHTLIVPKDHDKEPTKKSQELAFKVGGKIFEKLKPKDITTRPMKVMGHTILNVIPIYEDTDLEKRIQLTKKDFEEIRKNISEFKEDLIPTIEETKVGEVEQEKTPTEVKKENFACIFCAIANNQTQSFQIDENKDNVAILEINPISKGHTLVIPKNHEETTSLPSNSFTLAKKIAKKIKKKYKPNDIKINPTSTNGHAIIELVPLYDGTDVSQREKATEEELLKMQEELKVKRSTTKKAAKKKVEKKKTETKKPSHIGKFNLSKRPKFPELEQFGPRIP
jgi:histidine triad (HIT) family protein